MAQTALEMLQPHSKRQRYVEAMQTALRLPIDWPSGRSGASNRYRSLPLPNRLVLARLPGKADSRCDSILPFAIVSEGVIDPRDSRRYSARKIGSHDVAVESSAGWWISIGLADIEARITAQLVTELPDPFEAQSGIHSEGPAGAKIILHETRAFPNSEFAIK